MRLLLFSLISFLFTVCVYANDFDLTIITTNNGDLDILQDGEDNNIDLDVDKAINILLKQNVPKRELAKALSVVTNMSVNDLYERVKDL